MDSTLNEQKKKAADFVKQAEAQELRACWDEIQKAISPILDRYNAKLSYIEVRQGGQLIQSNIVVVKRTANDYAG